MRHQGSNGLGGMSMGTPDSVSIVRIKKPHDK